MNQAASVFPSSNMPDQLSAVVMFEICKHCKDKPEKRYCAPRLHVSMQESTGIFDIFNAPTCEYCDKIFKHHCSLVRHLKETHSNKRYHCGFVTCDFTTTRRENLTSHHKRMHGFLLCSKCIHAMPCWEIRITPPTPKKK